MGKHNRGHIEHQRCPKCGTKMEKSSPLRSRRKPHSTGFEKILVTVLKCPKGHYERSIKETPLQKEKPREPKKNNCATPTRNIITIEADASFLLYIYPVRKDEPF
jgi:hypothetical protein